MPEYLESLGAESVPKGGGCQQAGGLSSIGHIADSRHGVVDLK